MEKNIKSLDGNKISYTSRGSGDAVVVEAANVLGKKAAAIIGVDSFVYDGHKTSRCSTLGA